MCGISGFNWPDDALARSMNEALRHRGPDDEGAFVDEHVSLGHTRLSILDISDAGHQPMIDARGRFVIVYNGEIYNFRELRDALESEGHRFRSQCDTEVVLTAYAAWGHACVSRFNGMWAFCIYDREKKSLFLSRDRFGIKPLYYWTDGQQFIFASEIKALLRHAIPARLNRRIAFDYLVNDLVDHTHETFYTGIHCLPAAHHAHFDLASHRLEIERYYALPRAAADPGSFESTLQAAVASHLVSDVPVGSCLSGGIDSSTIVAIATESRAEFHTFSAVYGDQAGAFNERAHIDLAARHLGVQRHDVHPRDLSDGFENLLDAQDEPMIGSSPYAQYRVFECARAQQIPVLLDGQGADETLWGYPSAQGTLLGLLLRRIHLVDIYRRRAHFNRRSARFMFYPVVPDAVIRRAYARRPIFRALRAEASDHAFYLPRLDDMREYTDRWLTETNLPQLLRYEDRNSMAHSIESRVPFLDHRLVECCVNLPDSHKLGPRWTKDILRQTMRDRLPREIVWRTDKVGFETPETAWMTDAAGQALYDRTIHDDAAVFDLLDRETYRRVASQLTPNMRFRLICLERVMQRMAA